MPAKGAMKSSAALVLSMPQMRTSGRETRSLSSEKARARARPAEGLCPPSSHNSESFAMNDHNSPEPRLIELRRADPRYERLQYAGFLTCDLGQRVAQILLVIIVDGGDDADRGLQDHIGGIEPAAKAHFEDEIVRRRACKGEEGGSRG